MQFGHFDDSAKEYVITRPDTPRPWSNYMGSRLYGGIVTNNAGGYSFTRSPAQGRIMRFRYNSIPLDQPGRSFYLRDRDSADFWSAAWQPVGKPLSEYKTTCRFGTSYAVIESEYRGIKTESTYFIPLGQQFEYWCLKVTNTGKTPRRLSAFSFCEFTSEWNLMNDQLNLQYIMYIAEARWQNGFVSASSCGRLPEDLGNFSNRDQGRWWWMTQVGGKIAGHDLDREKFIGAYHSFHNPQVLEAGQCSNSEGFSDNICGAIQSDLELAPGESADIIVLLGIGKAEREGAKILAEYGNPKAAARELAKLKEYWHGLLGNLQTETPDPDFNHMTNVWNAYNALITFEWSRACSLIYTGDNRDGFGFRDTVQDFLGATSMISGQVHERLSLMISGQDATGGAQPEIRPWAHKPGQMKATPEHHYRSDDCLWFFNAVPTYIAETGDVGFLDTVIPYADKGEDTVMGHLRRALDFNLQRTGANGLPCGLSADWNDCLKLGFKGESVFVAFQVRLGLSVYADLCQRLGRSAERAWALSQREQLDATIRKTCWDGQWFIWAIAEDGTVFGTKNYPEGQIYLNTQVWAVISGAATKEQTDKCLDSVKERLATEYGVALCAPPFEKTPVNVMRAVLFNPGNKENGGIFSHTQSWAVLAEILRGNGNQAYAYYRAFMPAAQNDKAEIREIEPFAHCQSTHSKFSQKFGVSRIPWLSGTVSWSYYTATQWILGIRPEIDGLRIDPCIPTNWPGFTARRRFRGHTVEIVVKNPRKLSRGVKRLTINGKQVAGNIVPLNLLADGLKIEAELE
jgi:N,N'-diacetylchitobiose phosphorylase